MPRGLTFSYGSVSGTIQAFGNFPISITARSGDTVLTGRATLSIRTPYRPPTTVAPSFPTAEGAAQSWTTGESESLTIPNAGGTPAATYTEIAGSTKPAGMTWNAATRTLSGTPTTAGTGRFSVEARNSRGTDRIAYNWTVVAATAPAWSTAALAAVHYDVGDAVSFVLEDPGGRPGATITATGLPAGVTYTAATRTVAGTARGPAATGTATFTATNRIGSATLTLQWAVGVSDAPVWISTGGDEQFWNNGSAITALVTPAVDEGALGTTYSAAGMPDGVVFNVTTRTFSGTPTPDGAGTITVTATNAVGSDTYTYAWHVATLAAVAFPAAGEPKRYLVRAEPFSHFYPLATGFPPAAYTYANVPPGMRFNIVVGDRPTLLTGRPTTNGVYNVVITATNTVGSTVHTATYSFPLEVVDQPAAVRDGDRDIDVAPAGVNIALSGLTFHNGNLLALDVYNDQVLGFDATTGARVTSADVTTETIRAGFHAMFPQQDRQSVEPTAVCVDPDGAVLVLDAATNSVLAFFRGRYLPEKSINGSIVTAAIEPAVGGTALGIAHDGESVAISVAGNGIYFFTGGAVDTRKYLQQGRMVAQAGGEPYVTGLAWDGTGLLTVDARGVRVRRWRGATVDQARVVQNSVITAVNQSFLPAGVAWGDGRVWLADRDQNRIRAFRFGDLTNFPINEDRGAYTGVPRARVPIRLEPDQGVTPDVMALLPDDANLRGMTFDGTSLLVLDNANKHVWAFTAGARDTAKDFELNATPNYQGIAWDGTSVLVAVVQGREVHAYTNGQYDADRSLLGTSLSSQVAVGALRGITAEPASDTVWITTRSDQTVALTDGRLNAGRGLTPAQMREAFSGIAPGAVAYDGRLLYVSHVLGAVFAFQPGGAREALFDVSSFDLIRIANDSPLDPTDPDYLLQPESLPNRMSLTGLAWDGDTLVLLDNQNKRIWALSRRVADPPVGSVIQYFARGLPAGVVFDPERLEVSGAAQRPGSGTAVFTAVNLIGRDTYRFDWNSIIERYHEVDYTVTGLPRGMTFDEPTLTITGTVLEEGAGVIVVTASNGEVTDTYRIPWRAVVGVSPEREPFQRIPTSLRVHWPDAGTEVVDGGIVTAKKDLVLHDSYYNRGPSLAPSVCVIEFAEESRPSYRTLGQVPITDRILRIPPETPIPADVLDQHGLVWWQGVISDQFQVARTTQKTVQITLESTLMRLNRSQPPNDLIFMGKPIWGSASNYQDSVLYHLLTNQYGLRLEPSTLAEDVPVVAPDHTVIPITGPDQGEVVWNALLELLLKYGLVLYPTYNGTSYVIEKLSERTAVVNHRQDDPAPPWTTTRQPSAVRSLQAGYASTATYRDRAAQHIGTVWRAPDGFILPAGESWPRGATETNVVPLPYTPATFEPAPLGTRGKVLTDGTTLLACVNPQIINTPNGVTVRRANLHSLWADLFFTNTNPYPVLFQGLRIDADDVVFIANDERLVSAAGDLQGKGILSLSKRFVEARDVAQDAIRTIGEWIENRPYLHTFRWYNPAFNVMDLRADYIMAGDVRMRPVKLSEAWLNGTREVTVYAESDEA